MTTLSASLRLRPTRLGFLVDPDDADLLRRVFQICTCLWGGIFNPVIPVCSAIPTTWQDSVNDISYLWCHMRPRALPVAVIAVACVVTGVKRAALRQTCRLVSRQIMGPSGGQPQFSIENMGVYELLRRRCKFIICVDGEADPESTFHGQMTLVRHAQIDFGIRIEPRLDEMRPNPKSKLSRTHSQLFKIHYPSEGPERPAAVGLMLYLKLSLTGDEAELLKRYRTIHPDFPHQSTIDQFYDEEHFEAYRQLGVHVAEVVGTHDSRPKSRHRERLVPTACRQYAGASHDIRPGG